MVQPAKVRAVVAEIDVHAPGVRSFVLETERRVPKFRPGQFLHLAIDAYDPSLHWPESRVFSIASAPEERRRLRLTVSKVGEFTGRMMHLKVGDEVWVKLPYGEFVIEPEPNTALVLIAGGTGITPFASMLASSQDPKVPVRLLYGAADPDMLIYAGAIESATAPWTDFRWQAFIESGSRGGAVVGRLSAKAAVAAAEESKAPDGGVYYMAGPPAMLVNLREGLEALGVPPHRVRTDAWD